MHGKSPIGCTHLAFFLQKYGQIRLRFPDVCPHIISLHWLGSLPGPLVSFPLSPETELYPWDPFAPGTPFTPKDPSDIF